MKSLTATICLTFAVLLGSAGVNAHGNAAPLKIEETKFFVRLFAPSIGVSKVFHDIGTTIVPLVPGSVCYGWRIKVSSSIKLVALREEFTLPAEPIWWSGENDEFTTNRVIDKRRTSVTNEFITPDEGWVENIWCVVEGDPEGNYFMKVYFNDQFIKKFEFEVRRVPIDTLKIIRHL